MAELLVQLTHEGCDKHQGQALTVAGKEVSLRLVRVSVDVDFVRLVHEGEDDC